MADIAEAIFVYGLLTAFAGTILAAVYGHYCMGWSDPSAPGYKPRLKRPPPESAEDVIARLKARADKYEYLRQLGQAGEAYGDLKISAKNYKKMQEGGHSTSLGTLMIKNHRARIEPDGLGAHGGAEITTTTTIRLDPFSLSTRKVVTTRVVGASPGRGGGGGTPGTFGSLSRPNTPLLLLDGDGGGGGGGGGNSLFREPSPSLERSSSLPLHAAPPGGLRLPALRHPNSQPGNGAGPHPSPAEFKLHGRLDQLESLLGRVAERLELDPGAAPRFSSSSSSSSAAAPGPMEEGGGGGGGGGGISLGSMERFVAEESEGSIEQVNVGGGGGGGYGLSAFRAAAHLSTAENNQNSPTESMADGLSPAAQRDKPSPAEELANLMARRRDRQELARSRSSSGNSFNTDRGGGGQQQRLVGRGKKVSPYGA